LTFCDNFIEWLLDTKAILFGESHHSLENSESYIHDHDVPNSAKSPNISSLKDPIQIPVQAVQEILPLTDDTNPEPALYQEIKV
jgi:hypothetical protein